MPDRRRLLRSMHWILLALVSASELAILEWLPSVGRRAWFLRARFLQ